MNKRVAGRKSWHVHTLVKRALKSTKNDQSYWNCVWELHRRGGDEIFQEAQKLCENTNTAKIILGINILSQLGTPYRPYRDKTLSILCSFLNARMEPRILHSALVAIGHQNISNDTKGVKLISSFASHISKEVRFGVVSALCTREDRMSIATLIRLTRDKSGKVRDWATFAIGSQIDADTPAIRKALVDRLDDSDCNTRWEAMMGLAIRNDDRVLQTLRQELLKSDPTSLVFEAAEEFGDKSLLSLIEKQILSADDQTDDEWLTRVKHAHKNLHN